MPGPCTRLFSALALTLLAACGAGAQQRPFVVKIYPPSGATLGPVQEIEFTYNEPVTVLNQNDIQVVVDGLLIRTAIHLSADNRCVNIRPANGFFPPNTQIAARAVQGAVVNARRHYAADAYQTVFLIPGEASIPLGSPGLVTMVDPEDYSLVSSVATPAARDPIGIVSTIRGTQRRVWVQLDHGAGGGAALAWFDPSAITPMTVVPLTSTGELQSIVPAIVAAHSAQNIYVAFRDAGTSRIRVSRVNVQTATEELSIELMSVAADPGTIPLGLAVNDAESELYVSCADGATGTLAFVDLQTFSESDLDAGMVGAQGVTLNTGAGPLSAVGTLGLLGLDASADFTRVDLSTAGVTDLPNARAGFTSDVKRSRTGDTVIQSLAVYAGTVGLIWRRRTADLYATVVTPSVSDTVGGASAGATDALSIAWYGGSARFALLLQSPGGALMTRWAVTEPDVLEQEDLDAATAGIQAADLSVVAPAAYVMGETSGGFAD